MEPLEKYIDGGGKEAVLSLHNHSVWSDGAGTAEEMCRAAKEAGVRVFGLSDHWVVHPDPELMPVSWSIAPGKLPAYLEELARLKDIFNDENFTLLAGLEVDFFFENFEEVLAGLDRLQPDYLIGSVHYAGRFPIDNCAGDWKALSADGIRAVCETYWNKMLGAAECGRFSLLGHLDLPKKFGFLPDPGAYLPDARRVLDAAAARNIPIELNTAGWSKECREPYPSPEILREARARNIRVIIGADAHCPQHVTRNFAAAARLLRETDRTR
ncbi:MAG: histidinol-phosphatase [Lentisphaeria bacterium]|nr:histidinol-phosphatase [Lentisphaeria bacterium]